MKHLVAIIFFFYFSFFGFSQNFVTGVGGTNGSSFNGYGVNVREYFFIGEHICFGPEFSYFPERKAGEYKKSLLEFNITGHYIFEATEHLGIYPLTGLNYSIEFESSEYHSVKKDAFGINIGAGLHYRIKNIFPYFEYKYITGNLAQHIWNVGVLFSLQK